MSDDEAQELLSPDEKREVPVRVAESRGLDERLPEGGPVPLPSADRHSVSAEMLAALERVERLLGDMRGVLNSAASESRHREFSAGRLIGSILQALVLGLVLWALSDWVFGEDAQHLLIKLAFAAVFQLGALTALVWGRGVD